MIANVMNLRIVKPGEPAAIQTKSAWAALHLAGSPAAIAQGIEQYQQAGLECLLCGFESESVDDLLRQMRIFAEQVAPHFAKAA